MTVIMVEFPDVESALLYALVPMEPDIRFVTILPAGDSEQIIARVHRISGANRDIYVDRPIVDIDVFGLKADAGIVSAAARSIQNDMMSFMSKKITNGVIQHVSTIAGPTQATGGESYIRPLFRQLRNHDSLIGGKYMSTPVVPMKDNQLLYAAGDVVVWVGLPNVGCPKGFEDVASITAGTYACGGWVDTSGYIFKLDETMKDIPAAGVLTPIRTIVTGGTKSVQMNFLEALNPVPRALYDDVPIFPLDSTSPLVPSTTPPNVASYIQPGPANRQPLFVHLRLQSTAIRRCAFTLRSRRSRLAVTTRSSRPTLPCSISR